MSNPQHNDDERDFADNTIPQYKRLFPIVLLSSAVVAGVTPSTPWSHWTAESTLAAIESLLFMIDILVCAGGTAATIFGRAQLKAGLRAGGGRKFAIMSLALLAQVLFLAGMLFFFLTAKNRAAGVGWLGMGVSVAGIGAAVYAWTAQLVDGDKGIRLPETE